MVENIKRLPIWGVYALLVYMPFHIFLVQSLSLVTGGISVWKAAKDVFAVALLALVVVLVWQQHKNTKQFNLFLALAIAYGAIHLLVWALNPDIYRQTALVGMVYNNRLLWYLLIGLGTALLWPKKMDQNRLMRVVLMVSTVVCLLGVLQYFLPKDILTHLGYSLERGVRPAFFIDDKPNLPRIMSTLRDPNSLGAFLILPITLLVYKLFHSPAGRRTLIVGLLGLHGLTLFLTFSRSAWLGTVISIGVLGIYQMRKQFTEWLVKYWPLVLGTVLLVGSLTLMFRNQYTVQNILVHSDENTVSKIDSNQYHLEFAKKGLEGIRHKPIGHGPGTAGIVSISNPDGGLLTENYYIQIGYEIGVVGLILFITILILLYKELLKHRTPLAICLVASFWGYVLINMLLHGWTNEAVAAQWWLLSGIAVGMPIVKQKTK